MAQFLFNSGVEGFVMIGDNGNGAQPPIAGEWDSGEGWPGVGCLNIDLYDLNAGSHPEYYDTGQFQRTGLSVPMSGNLNISFWYKIQNRKATSRTYRIDVSYDYGVPVPNFIEVVVPGLSTTTWLKYDSVAGSIGTLEEFYISIAPTTDDDGWSSYWVDTVFMAEDDPTQPPPAVTTNLAPSSGGIPWLIKEGGGGGP